MKPLDLNPMPTWMDARLEAYLDGELTAQEQHRFEHGLAAGGAWEADLALARRIRDELHALPLPACPPHVLDAVLQEVAAETARELPPWAKVLARLAAGWQRQWQPALAMATLAGLVVAAALLGRPPAPSAEQAELARASAEVKWTLAYLSKVGRQTGASVRNEILETRVVLPMQHALGTVFDETTPPAP